MHPVVDLSLGGHHLVVTAYRLMLIVALVVVPVVALLVGSRLGVPRRRMGAVLAAAAAAALVGARLAAVTLSRGDGEPWVERVIHFGAGDFALFGGLALGAAAGYGVCRLAGIDPFRAGDAVAPALGAGIVILRIGCFLAGCCFGEETSVAWGVTYPPGSPAHLDQIGSGNPVLAVLQGPSPVHPIPLYEVAVAVAGVGIALLVLRNRAPAGAALASLVAWYSLWRLALQPLRAVSDASAAPPWLWPAVFAVAAVVAVGWLLRGAGRVRLVSRRAVPGT